MTLKSDSCPGNTPQPNTMRTKQAPGQACCLCPKIIATKVLKNMSKPDKEIETVRGNISYAHSWLVAQPDRLLQSPILPAASVNPMGRANPAAPLAPLSRGTKGRTHLFSLSLLPVGHLEVLPDGQVPSPPLPYPPCLPGHQALQGWGWGSLAPGRLQVGNKF